MRAGERLRAALDAERPLLVPGAYSPTAAMVAAQAGFRAAYLSGSGVAAAFGLPDLAMTTMTEVVAEARRITAVLPDVPLLVDVDTGFGSELSIDRTVTELIHAGVAGLHIEDQEATKRCGHRPNKRIVGTDEMVARIRAAHAARLAADPSFLVMARTDAFAQEGLAGTIARARAYVDAGADALFPEALATLDDYRRVCDAVPVPVLANITEFGKTPLFTAAELAGAGVRIVLYPLTLYRTSLGAIRDAARELRREGTQRGFVDRMMSREDFYTLIHYHDYERRVDASQSSPQHSPTKEGAR